MYYFIFCCLYSVTKGYICSRFFSIIYEYIDGYFFYKFIPYHQIPDKILKNVIDLNKVNRYGLIQKISNNIK